jgi:hypothetical protein
MLARLLRINENSLQSGFGTPDFFNLKPLTQVSSILSEEGL